MLALVGKTNGDDVGDNQLGYWGPLALENKSVIQLSTDPAFQSDPFSRFGATLPSRSQATPLSMSPFCLFSMFFLQNIIS